MSFLSRLSKPNLPPAVLQFGEGNFLRGFVDPMIDDAVKMGLFSGTVAIVKPTGRTPLSPWFQDQNCNYTLMLRGQQEGKLVNRSQIITAVSQAVSPYEDFAAYERLILAPELKFVVSNTTEAGISLSQGGQLEDRPPDSFPAKVTQLLWRRYEQFGGDCSKGLVFLPTELIPKNGEKLFQYVLTLSREWGLPQTFIQWVEDSCVFCNTLVDRIVSGYPGDQKAEDLAQYQDRLLVCGEPFGLWVIECPCPERLEREFPLRRAGAPVLLTQDLEAYRVRKVRVLNGAHTGFSLAALEAGLSSVDECICDPDFLPFLKRLVFDEAVPTVPLNQKETTAFAEQVMERFQNPYLYHRLSSIAVNSVSKWKERLLPTLKDLAERNKRLPPCICFSLAALIWFYLDPGQSSQDSQDVLDFFRHCRQLDLGELVRSVLQNQALWGEDLSKLPGLEELTARNLGRIREQGMRGALRTLLQQLKNPAAGRETL